MSIEVISQQIRRFLASEGPEVMSIKGAWGVGKTYAWNRYLLQAKNQQKVALQKYSYVSLFGINSLSDLKFSIFENLVEDKMIGRKPTIETFRNNVDALAHSIGQNFLPLIPARRPPDAYHNIFSSLLFLSLEKALICIDDFERKGHGIAAQDILGLISQLKEQKKCKVILILNDESLSGDSSLDYVKLREKVIDTELRFAPTARECVAIALTRDRVARLLGDDIVTLGINNIRIIKKIEKLALAVIPVLNDYDDQVLKRALHSLALLVWCYYSRAQDIPDYQFVLSRNSSFSDLDDTALTTQQQSWCAVLRRYDNYFFDDFDTPMARFVENGYLDEAWLRKEAEVFNEKLRADRSQSSFQAAWHKFNESFADNSREVIGCLSESFKDNARFISPANLDGAVRLLRNLGKDALATRIIDLYIEKRKAEVELFNLDSRLWAGAIKDAEVITKFEQTFQARKGLRSLEDTCRHLLAGDAPADEDEALLAQGTVAEYVALFKKLKEPELSRIIDLCLQFGRLGGTTACQEAIAERAAEALRRIGRENKLNASRVLRFGIKVD